jgi:hypothetical protein
MLMSFINVVSRIVASSATLLFISLLFAKVGEILDYFGFRHSNLERVFLLRWADFSCSFRITTIGGSEAIIFHYGPN